MIEYLDYEQVIAIHTAATGGSGPVRDRGAIQSAVMRPQMTVGGDDAYPTIWEKAAALLQSLACNHGFVDGNKRTAWTAAEVFLGVNGHRLGPDYDVDEAERLVLAVATGRIRDISAIASELVKFVR